MKTSFSFTLLICLALLTACTGTATPIASATGPQAWIDSPLDGSSLPLGDVQVISHSSDASGIAQVELSVNGTVVRTDLVPASGPALTLMDQTWTPTAPGNYLIAVRAQNKAGAWSSLASVTVTVTGEQLIATAESPTLTNTPTQDVSITPSVTATETPTATATSTSTTVPPTFTFTPTFTPTFTLTPTNPPSFIDFSADSTSLTAGQCTNLRWNSGNIQAIFLDGQGVTGSETRQVCPTTTTTYTLTANSASGQLTKQVIIQVTGAPPVQKPSFGSITWDNNTFYNVEGCGPTTLFISAEISNADTAVVVYTVQGGPQLQQNLSHRNNNTWTVVINNTDITNNIGATGQMPFYLVATNSAGSSQSQTFQVLFSNCKP